MKPVHPVALFRLSVLGQLVSRQNLARGELKAIVKELALKQQDPGLASRQRKQKQKKVKHTPISKRRNKMFRRHFGITHCPLGKQTKTLWQDGHLEKLNARFNWLLESPGIGLLATNLKRDRSRAKQVGWAVFFSHHQGCISVGRKDCPPYKL